MEWTWLPAAALLAWAVVLDQAKSGLASLDYRLPHSIVPERYQLYLAPFHPDNSKFTGNVTITVTATEATSNVTVHVSNLQVIRTAVRTASALGRELTVTGTDNSSDSRQFYVLRLGEPLELGERYELVFQFVGELRESLYGFYKRVYADAVEEREIAATQFEATYARKAFPCFDEPHFKSTFQINIARSTNMTALSNMPLMSTSAPDPGLDGLVWDVFAESPPMSTYLVAAVVGDLEAVNTSDPRITLWVRPGVSDLATYSSDFSPRVLRAFEEYTGLPYSLPKLDQIAVPTYSITMENWGLVIYLETNLLYSWEWSSAATKQEVSTVVVHELAHQWFGNLVTVAWWQYMWLNEGIAQFFAYHILDQLETSWRVMDQFVVTQMQPMLMIDSSGTTDALNSDCSTPTEIARKFGFISYSKGASVTRMIQHALTEETFRKGIHGYLSSRQFTTAQPQHLYDALQSQAAKEGRLDDIGVPVQRFVDGWTSQSGYPLLTVDRRYHDGGVLVSQTRFFLDDSEVSNERWCVPLTWTSKTNSPAGYAVTKPAAWLLDNQSSILLSNVSSSQDWLIFNNQQSGYYRVNYDEQNWRLLTEQLSSDGYQNIHVLNRAQLLDDAFNLARAGRLDYQIALNMTRYLTRETDSIPWTSAITVFTFIDLMLVGTEAHEAFQMYVLGLLREMYDSVGFMDQSGTLHLTRVLKNQVLTWACGLGHAGCVRAATEMFAAWYNSAGPDDDNTIHPSLKLVVYCTAIANGGHKEWDFLFSRYANGNAPMENPIILHALGCSKNVSTLNRYLLMLVNRSSLLEIRHVPDAFSAVYRNPRGTDFALNFFVDNYKNMSQIYDVTNLLARKIPVLAARLTTQQQIKKLDDFLTANKNIEFPAPITQESMIASSRKNLYWKNRYYHTIEKWLAEKKEKTADDSTHSHDSFLSWIFFVILIFLQI